MIKGNYILRGFSVKVLSSLIWTTIGLIVLFETKSLKKTFQLIKNLVWEKNLIYGKQSIKRFALSRKGVQFNINVPHWPSRPFIRYFQFTVRNMYKPHSIPWDGARMVLFAITKKCPLNCEHCYEWDEINKKETLSDDHIQNILEYQKNAGAAVFLLGGGEPLNRFETLLSSLQRFGKDIYCMITTSAHNMNPDKVKELKNAGLSGMWVSLDHYDETEHNQFRGNKKSYQFVKEGVHAALSEGLTVGLSLCTTRDKCNSKFLHDYMELAKEWGVGFVQWVEPRAAGKYSGKNVELNKQQTEILDNLYEAFQFGKDYRDYPLISHPGYAQRKVGCGAAGVYNLFIDTDGKKHACPFCRLKNRDNQKNVVNSCENFEERVVPD